MPFIVATTKCSHHVEYALDGVKEIPNIASSSKLMSHPRPTERLLNVHNTCNFFPTPNIMLKAERCAGVLQGMKYRGKFGMNRCDF